MGGFLKTFIFYVTLMITGSFSPFLFASDYFDVASHYFYNHIEPSIKIHNVLDELENHNKQHEQSTLDFFIAEEEKWKKEFKEEVYSTYLTLSSSPTALMVSRIKNEAQGLIHSMALYNVYGLSVAVSDMLNHYWHEELFNKKEDLESVKTPLVSDVEFSKNDRAFVVRVIMPLFKEEKLVGSLVLEFDAEELENYILDQKVKVVGF